MKTRPVWWRKMCDRLVRHEFILLVVLAVLILRIPNVFEPYWYGDEGIYLTVGQAMRRGLKLYAEIMDHKTPLIYVMAMISGSLVWFKAWLILSSVAAVVIFHMIAQKLLGRVWAERVATVVFALTTTLPRYEGNIANGELLLMPMVLLGVWLIWQAMPAKMTKGGRVDRWRQVPGKYFFGAGAMFSLAVLLKVPAIFDLAGVGMFLVLFVPQIWSRKNAAKTLALGGLLIAGFVMPILASMLYFAAMGTFEAYIDYGLLYNFRYIELWSPPFSHPVTLFLVTMKGRLIILGMGLTLLWLMRKKLSLGQNFILIWLMFSAMAAFLSLRPYPHYFIQAMPALSLAVGAGLMPGMAMKIWVVGSLAGLQWVLSGLGFVPYPTVAYYREFVAYASGRKPYQDYAAWFDSKTRGTYEMAKWLEARTNPSDRIFIWGNEPMVYSLANRSPVGRFVVDFHIQSVDAYEETYEALVVQRPMYIIDTRQDQRSFPDLYALLLREYLLQERLGRFDIYRLLP